MYVIRGVATESQAGFNRTKPAVLIGFSPPRHL